LSDPISQESQVLRQAQRAPRKAICDVEFKHKKELGISIDISEYRMPQPRATVTRHRERPSHSDGFEGKEATPTGITMPFRRSQHRPERIPKITLRFGQLIMVSKRPPGGEQPRNIDRSRKTVRGPRAQQMDPITPPDDFSPDENEEEPLTIQSETL